MQPQPGFLSTLGSDVYQAGKGLVELPGKTAAYLAAGQPDKNVAKQLEDAQEAHKHAVYQSFRQDFHAGNYRKAFSGLINLFDPRFDDPNDPLSQAMSAQWQSSAQAKAKMMEAAKKGDTLAAVQHAAGIMPLASQVDAAMDAYRENPTRENLAHVVSSSIPAFVPALSKGVSKIAGKVSDVATEGLRPTTVEVAGEKIPVRASTRGGEVPKFAEKMADERMLREFDARQTQPAVRKAASSVSAESAGVPKAATTPPAEDAFGLGKTSESLQTRSQGVFQKLDELSNGEFSKGQNEAKLARGSTDFEGRKAYQAALEKQQALFDTHAGSFPEGDLSQAKADWRRSMGMEELRVRFNRSIHPTPIELAEQGVEDPGYVNGKQFREAIMDAKQSGEFEKAGLSPAHVRAFEDLGRLLEQSNNIQRFSAISRLLGKAGVVALGGGQLAHTAEAIGMASGGKWSIGQIMGRILTTPAALQTLNDGIRAGTAPSTVAAAVQRTLRRLVTEESGEMTVPFTGSGDASTADVEQPYAPTFYSKAARVADEKIPGNASGDQILATLRNSGVKENEISWMGLDDYLKGKPKVSKADLQQFINENQIQLKDVDYGTPEQRQMQQLSQQRHKVYAENNRIWADHLRYADGSTELFNAMKQGSDLGIKQTISLMPGELQEPARRFVATDRQLLDLDNQLSKLQYQIDKSGAKAPKFEQYTLPGPKDSYTEKLLTLPRRQGELPNGYSVGEHGGNFFLREPDGTTVASGYDSREELLKDLPSILRARGTPNPDAFQSSHFDEPNVLAHVRYTDRIDVNGKKNLFLEEVQSDWHQKGKTQGYRSDNPESQLPPEYQLKHNGVNWVVTRKDGGFVPNRLIGETEEQMGKRFDAPKSQFAADKGQVIAMVTGKKELLHGVPNAPFKSDWHELAMKRMLREAAEKNYDRLSWTTGAQQAERYDLSKQVDSIDWLKNSDGTYSIAATKDGEELVRKDKLNDAAVDELVGKDVGQKIREGVGKNYSVQGTHNMGTLSGLDLKIGGQWAEALYDRAIPNFLKKYAKRWGAKVGETSISDQVYVVDKDGKEVWAGERKDIPELDKGEQVVDPGRVHFIDITPAMKRSLLKEGQPIAQNKRDSGDKDEQLVLASTPSVVGRSRSVLAGSDDSRREL
jgi:hypothetical protein